MGSITTEYDFIGSQYDVIKTTSFNKIERSNFQRVVQPFLRKPQVSVIDFACGTGFYSYLLLTWGATSLTGVDISTAMLDGARSRLADTKYASQTRFIQGDGFKPRSYDESGSAGFDVATGSWFLNYARNLDELTGMFQSISMNLKRDGVFVGICYHATDDMDNWAATCNEMRSVLIQTGVLAEYREKLENGLGYVVQIFGIPPPGSPKLVKGVEFSTYHLKKSVFEEAARAGNMLGKLEWHHPEYLGPELRKHIGFGGEENLAKLQENPQFSVLVVWKN